jgi:hypothetical protein
MKGSWIRKTDDHGSGNIRKDRYGFWKVRFNSREHELVNPYVFPEQISQVFFMGDNLELEFKVVLYHEPRTTRVVGNDDMAFFGAARSNNCRLSTPRWSNGGQHTVQATPVEDGEGGATIHRAAIEALDETIRDSEDNEHLDDFEYEDEVDVEYTNLA